MIFWYDDTGNRQSVVEKHRSTNALIVVIFAVKNHKDYCELFNQKNMIIQLNKVVTYLVEYQILIGSMISVLHTAQTTVNSSVNYFRESPRSIERKKQIHFAESVGAFKSRLLSKIYLILLNNYTAKKVIFFVFLLLILKWLL